MLLNKTTSSHLQAQRGCRSSVAHANAVSAVPSVCTPARRAGARSRQQLRVSATYNRSRLVHYRRADELPPSAAVRAPLSQNASTAAAPEAPTPADTTAVRPRVVILGSGWASMSLITALPKNITAHYDVVLVSPRNYFLYTPLLPAVAAGSMEERSIVQPVRQIMNDKGRYFEAMVTGIDPAAKEVTACFPDTHSNNGHNTNGNGHSSSKQENKCFTLPYDILVVGIGSVNNTFGVPGVAEHCYFLKCLEDAHNLRTRVTECFERAALPNATPEDRQRLLSFVVCGGGPTGVEVAAELHDMIYEDLKNDFPELMPFVRVRVVEMMHHVLATYNPRAGEYTAKLWKRKGIELLVNSRVLSVESDSVTVADKDGNQTDIPFGACVWSTGIGMHPLIQQIQKAFPGVQTHNRCVLTDEYMRVEGSDGSMFVFGDAATIHPHLACEHVDELFAAADRDGDGLLSVAELQQLLHSCAKDFPHLAKHARFLDGKQNRFASLIGPLVLGSTSSSALAALDLKQGGAAQGGITREQLQALLHDMDSSVRALPATAQVAKQQGEFVADLLQRNTFSPNIGTVQLKGSQKPFKYFHKGSLAYVGSDRAIMDVPVVGPITGKQAGLAWRGYETVAQISPRNALLVLQSFVATKIFGRDLSQV